MKFSEPTLKKIQTHFRLTSQQLSVIHPGMKQVMLAHSARLSGSTALHAYPSGIYPLPPGKGEGAFDPEMMEAVTSAWVKINRDGVKSVRLAMTHVEIRALIFAIRIHQDYRRWLARRAKKKRDLHRREDDLRNGHPDEAFKRHSTRLIATLERRLKTASRRASSERLPEFREESARWQNHLRWMRLKLVCFRPLPPVSRGQKGMQIAFIDDLMKFADVGLRKLGYKPPEPARLRKLIRLRLQYSRRGREKYLFDFWRASDFGKRYHLSNFVLQRLGLQRIKRTDK
jgi:hypothetical protein